MSKATEGKWHADGACVYCEDADGVALIATANWMLKGEQPFEVARLIAAAPDLLKSVEELMAAFGGVATHPQQAAWDWAKAALAKARGEGGEPG